MELRKQGAISQGASFTYVDSPRLDFPTKFEYPSLSGPGDTDKKPKTAQEFFMTGNLHYEANNDAVAEPFFKEAMRLTLGTRKSITTSATSATAKRYEEARSISSAWLPCAPKWKFMPFFLTEVYWEWKRPKEEERFTGV